MRPRRARAEQRADERPAESVEDFIERTCDDVQRELQEQEDAQV